MEGELLSDITSDANSVKTSELILSQSESQKSYVCFVCLKEFSCKRSLNNHTASHILENRFRCEACGESFSTITDHAEHCCQHEEITCFTCNETFSSSLELGAHQQLHLLLLSDIYVCNICDKPFPNETEMQTHHRQHFGKCFQCKECNKYFSSKNNLIIHSQTHIVTKSFECEICNEKFHCKIDLQRHYQVHINIRPFACNSCDKTFKTQKRLTVHLMDHGGSYVCLERQSGLLQIYAVELR
ncbi:gastrula zinc finger protein XlCGF49.1-like [Argiope bruennichi]|uniref:gastrula zinc finger protein XlCGF49.1-like n=1 Tax=Argiope bruennichi TaxID=94029 RepID=UPI002494C4FE|nr:gastrula zinc finger protein XlCGF49.1-like [Argiope bruennichi]